VIVDRIGECWFSCPHKYNHIDEAFYLQFIHSILNENLSYDDISRYYGYPYKTIKSIARGFEENTDLVPKRRGGIRYPILQDEHIQWFIQRLNAHPDIIVL